MRSIILTLSVLLLGAASVSGSAADTIHLKMIPSVEPPVIENRVARIAVNFIFDRVSSTDYWMHYDKEHHCLVFEFFGTYLADSIPSIRGTDVLKNIRAENSVTDFAFNKKVSRLIMTLEPGWHYESWVTGSTTLRLSLWTNLDPTRKIIRKKVGIRYFLYGAIIAGFTVGALYLFQGL